MNGYFILATGFVMLYALFLMSGMAYGERHDSDSIRGFGITLSVCALMILLFFGLGMKKKYETHMINGTYKIGYEQEIKIVNGDTIIDKYEPYVILKK